MNIISNLDIINWCYFLLISISDYRQLEEDEEINAVMSAKFDSSSSGAATSGGKSASAAASNGKSDKSAKQTTDKKKDKRKDKKDKKKGKWSSVKNRSSCSTYTWMLRLS